MLGMATIRREVRIRRLSKVARPSRRVLMELAMAGLQTLCDVWHDYHDDHPNNPTLIE